MGKIGNNIKTVVLLTCLSGMILFAGQMIGGPRGIVIALVVTAAMNFFSFFFSDKIALMTMQAQEVGPEHPLYQITEGLVHRANLPMPRVYLSPHAAPNAFATGRSPKNAAVCATAGLMQMLSRNEIAGVMAHELAHVKHRDILITSIAVTIGGAINMIGNMMMWNNLFGGRRGNDNNPLQAIGAILFMVLGPIAAMMIQMAISRQREYAADTEGAHISGDPMHLATALEKIHQMSQRIPMEVNPAFNAMMIAEPNQGIGKSLANLFSTHPPLKARLKNLIGRESTGMQD